VVARFGDALGSLGDLDSDGVNDLIELAGSSHAHEEGPLWAIFLNADGTVKADRRIAAVPGSFPGTGNSVAALGDLDGDGVTEIAVGTPNDDDGVEDAGAVWILFLNTDATVKAAQKISMATGGFTGWLVQYGYFGRAVSAIGDVDGDGVNDLAVSAPYYPERVIPNNGWWWQGQVWILLLNPDGTVKANQEIAEGDGGFTGTLVEYELFGHSLAAIGDLDGDGTPDLAVGAEHNPDGGPFVGAIWVLFLNPDGTVKSHQRISPTTGGFTGSLRNLQHFTHSLASLGDVDEDGIVDLAVGHEEGPVWLLFLTSNGTVKAHQRIDGTPFGRNFGWAVAGLGDVNSDGVRDWAVSDASISTVWIAFGDGAPDPPCASTPATGCEPATKANFVIRRKSTDAQTAALAVARRTCEHGQLRRSDQHYGLRAVCVGSARRSSNRGDESRHSTRRSVDERSANGVHLCRRHRGRQRRLFRQAPPECQRPNTARGEGQTIVAATSTSRERCTILHPGTRHHGPAPDRRRDVLDRPGTSSSQFGSKVPERRG
jgi:hypothetical protein